MGDLFIVVHEYHLSPTRDGQPRTDYGVASSLYRSIDGADNQLAFCEGMQAKGRPGSDGRYYIARVTEITPAPDEAAHAEAEAEMAAEAESEAAAEAWEVGR